MKILICTNSLGARGGIERVTIVKANAFADMPGNEVHICYTDKGTYPETTIHPLSDKVIVHDAGVSFWDMTPRNFFVKQWRLRKNLKSLINDLQPDIVISTGQQEKYALATINTNAVKVREYHFNSNYRRMLNDSVWKVRLVEWFEYKVLGLFFDKNFLLTKEDKDTWFKDRKKFDYQYNPCSFDIPETLPNGERENVVVAVGRFVYQKNFDALIRIWARIQTRGWKLRFIGDGNERGELEALVKELELEDSVEFMGFRNDVQEQLDRCKILAMTSRYEGMPLNLIEAMSRGVVPICFHFPYGAADVIADGENGVLVDYLNEEEFASKLITLMHDTKLKEMSSAAHNRSKDFRVETIVAEWMKKYKQLVEIKKRSY